MAENYTDHLARPGEFEIEKTSWGELHWQVSADRGNSETMTIGRCFINPGDQNGVHMHPNCDEVLSVLKGHVEHSWDDQKFEMREGDVISIPSGVYHNARNLTDEVCELAISFSSAYRQTVGQEG